MIDKAAVTANRSFSSMYSLSICLSQQGSKPKEDEEATDIGERCYDDAGRRCRVRAESLESQWHHRASDAAKATTDRDGEEHHET